MNVLSIDTSGRTAGAAVFQEGTVTGEVSVSAEMTHSETLLPMIDRLLHYSGLCLDDMDYIACSSGPGSFTGLRIGAAAAMGLSRGAGKRLLPTPALDALAYNIFEQADHEAGQTFITPVMDARRSQVYTALYAARGGFSRLTDYAALSVEEALALPDGYATPDDRVCYTGDGCGLLTEAGPDPAGNGGPDRSRRYKRAFYPPRVCRPLAVSIGFYALKMLADGFEPDGRFDLVYIRRPQAEQKRIEASRALG